MGLFDYIWVGLLAVGAVVEAVALAKRSPDRKAGTFSNFCRWLAGTSTKPVHWRAYPIGAVLVAASVWWFGHVMLGWGP